MSQNVYQFIDLQYADPPKKPLKIRKIKFVKICEPFSEGQAKAQADRCLSCGNPHCEWRYPVHSYIPNWPKLTNEGHIFGAAGLSRQTSTLPEICGRVCPQDHLYRGSCTLNDEFGAVTIGNTERYINDKAFEMGWRPNMSDMKQTGKKVAIIGAGLAGLTCTNVLTRNGVKAIIFDRYPEIGGLLTSSIPAFRLEKEVMTRRRGIFTNMDIKFKFNAEVGRDMRLDDLLSDYDAVFLGVRTYRSMRGELENEDADGVYAALPSLVANTKQLMGFGETRDEPFVSIEGRRVVVLGGGDTAMDCVCTSVRQGAKHVTCVYRRDEENMLGSRREAKNAWEEGVEFKFSVRPPDIEVNDSGKVNGVEIVCTEMDEPDVKGCRHAEIVTGSEHIVPANAVIMAFDFHPHNIEWLTKHNVGLDSRRCIIAPEDNDSAFQTSNPKIFAGDDIVRDSDLVVTATAEGRRAADGIMNWLEV